MQVDKIQELINHVKANSAELVSKGVDKKELHEHVAELEAEMKKSEPDHDVLRERLASLETTIGEAEESMISTGVFQLLNQIFGTGVPNP